MTDVATETYIEDSGSEDSDYAVNTSQKAKRPRGPITVGEVTLAPEKPSKRGRLQASAEKTAKDAAFIAGCHAIAGKPGMGFPVKDRGEATAYKLALGYCKKHNITPAFQVFTHEGNVWVRVPKA